MTEIKLLKTFGRKVKILYSISKGKYGGTDKILLKVDIFVYFVTARFGGASVDWNGF